MKINILIQARMSSSRFPGKVLAPVEGIPLIKQLINNVQKVRNKSAVVVLTSSETSDDPLTAFLTSIDCSFFRGSLNNVFKRFSDALDIYPCDYFVRLCADSPFVDSRLMEFMIDQAFKNDYDLISNAFSRKFPKGQGVEIVKTSIFRAIRDDCLSDEEKEHVIPYFYKNRRAYKCLFLEYTKDCSHINQCIDTLSDLKEIEKDKYIFSESEICVVED